jgi:hypothetical protein
MRQILSEIHLLLISFFITFPMISCSNKKPVIHWNKVQIESKISKNIIYTQLNREEEIYSYFEKHDSSRKRTSDVAYDAVEDMSLENNKYSKYNNCRASLFGSDTVMIDIGISSPFTGHGFRIHFTNGNFFAQPYYWQDAIDPDAPESRYETVYQKLILDKAVYKPGDSLFGYIDFKITETNRRKKPVEHQGKGYFRARVEKP